MLGKKIFVMIVLSMICLLWVNSYVLAQNTNLSELKDVRYDDSTGNINFVFSSKLSLLSTPKINYHDEYFEFVVQDAFVKESSFFDINSTLFSKVGVYPVTVDSLGIRIFTDKQTSLDKYQFSSLDFNNNILTFDFDKYKYDQLVIAKNKDRANQLNTTAEAYNPDTESTETTNAVAATTAATTTTTTTATTKTSTNNEVSESDLLSNIASIKNSLSSSSSTKENLETSSLKFKDTTNIRSNITSIVIFIVFLSLGCMFLYFFRPAILKKKSIDKSNNLNIKTLAVSNLSAKQKITLIEIAGEKILLGISSNNISFLTKLSDGTNTNQYENNYSNKIFVSNKEENLLNAFRPSSSLKEMSQVSGSISSSSSSSSSSIQSSSPSKSSHISGAYFDKESKSRMSAKATNIEKDSIDSYDPGTGDLIKKDTQKSTIENVTKLIREKLKNLPSMEE